MRFFPESGAYLCPAEARSGLKSRAGRRKGSRRGVESISFFLQPGRLDVGFGHLPEQAELRTRKEELASQAVSPAPNFSSRRRVGGRWEDAGPQKVGPVVPYSPGSSRSRMPIQTRLRSACTGKSTHITSLQLDDCESDLHLTQVKEQTSSHARPCGPQHGSRLPVSDGTSRLTPYTAD